MSPFIAELSSRDSNSRGKRFSHFQACADCGVAGSFQVPTGRVPISRLRATRHWEMVVNGVVKDERSSLRLPGLQMLMFQLICSLEELANIGLVRKRGARGTNVSIKKGPTCARSTHLEIVYVQPQYARACASAYSPSALPLDPWLSLGECR